LCARYRQLARAGKPANVVTAAIAREISVLHLGHRPANTSPGSLIGGAAITSGDHI
jgi:hypothetical protein